MEVAFQHLQVRAAGESGVTLRGAFDAPGQLQVDGSFMTTFTNVMSVTHAGELVYGLAMEHFSDVPDWWGIEYVYATDRPDFARLMLNETRPHEAGFFLSRLDNPLTEGEQVSEELMGYLLGSPYCRRAEWMYVLDFQWLITVQLSEAGLAWDRSELYEHLLAMR